MYVSWNYYYASYNDLVVMETVHCSLSLQVSIDGNDSSSWVDNKERTGNSYAGSIQGLMAVNFQKRIGKV